MKKLMSVALGLSLLAPVASFAQKKPAEKEAATVEPKTTGKGQADAGKKAVKTEAKSEKGHKGGKTGKGGKVTTDKMTTSSSK